MFLRAVCLIAAFIPNGAAIGCDGGEVCPAKFDPDDPAWALVGINEALRQPFVSDMFVVERIRNFAYIPNMNDRISFGIGRKIEFKCTGEVRSYVFQEGGGEKRIVGRMNSVEVGARLFLFTEKGLAEGDKVFVSACVDKKRCIEFILYKDSAQIARRVL